MNKQELKSICESASDKIIASDLTKENIEKSLLECSHNGKTLDDTEKMYFCLKESRRFTQELIYNVLCEVLDIR